MTQLLSPWKILIVSLAFASSLAFPAFSAQEADASAPGDLHFLESFAIRTYDRGDILQSKKEFERILRIDPDNAVAKEYLTRITAEKTTPANRTADPVLTRLGEVTSDIQGLKNEIARRERDSQALYLTIRSLITENDALYVALRKRTRDLAELRAKFQGTPYNEQYSALMKDLPPDRIAQRPLTAHDILPDAPAALASASPAETEPLTQDIAIAEKELKTLQKATAPDKKKIKDLEGELEEKRMLLVEKTALLAENKASLVSLQEQLTSANRSLKDLDGRYADALNKLDKLAQEIRTEAALRDAESQKKYRELLGSYAEKIKELDGLKASLANLDSIIIPVKTALADKHQTLADLNSSIQTKDQKIEEYRSLLLKMKDALAQKDQVIQDKNAAITAKTEALAKKDQDIADKNKAILEKENAIAKKNSTIKKQTTTIKLSNDQLNGVHRKISSIQSLLSENDKDIAQIQAGFSRVKALIKASAASPKPSPAAAKPVAAASNQPESSGKKPVSIPERIRSLEKSLADKSDAMTIMQLKFDDIEKELAERKAATRRLEDDLLAAQEKAVSLEQKALTLQQENDAPKTIPPLSTTATVSLPREPRRPSAEAAMLHNILATKDKTIVDLNKKIIEKSVENRELSVMLDTSRDVSRQKTALIQEIALLNARLAKAEEENKALENSRCALQSSELDRQESEAIIHELQKVLNKKTAALNAADQQISILQENLSVIQIKQEAIKDLIDKRDKELFALKKQIAQNGKNPSLKTPGDRSLREHDETIALLKKTLTDTQNRLIQRDRQTKELESTLKKQTAQINDLRKRLNAEKK